MAGREEAVTQYLISDSAALVQFLHLLLALDEETVVVGAGAQTSAEGETGVESIDASQLALLEPLLQTLDRHPDRLDGISQLFTDLRATPEGRAKLTPELDAVWAAVWEARTSR